jgi:hypothetical protein
MIFVYSFHYDYSSSISVLHYARLQIKPLLPPTDLEPNAKCASLAFQNGLIPKALRSQAAVFKAKSQQPCLLR